MTFRATRVASRDRVEHQSAGDEAGSIPNEKNQEQQGRTYFSGWKIPIVMFLFLFFNSYFIS